MKNIIIVLAMLISLSVSSQEKLEGLWAARNYTESDWYTAIDYDKINEKMNIVNFSFVDTTSFDEEVLYFTEKTMNTQIKNRSYKRQWNNNRLYCKYTLINDTLIKLRYTGDFGQVVYLRKIRLDVE
jgi:hypothetical protein